MSVQRLLLDQIIYVGVKQRHDRNGKYEAYATMRLGKSKQVSISSFKTAVEGAVAHDVVAWKAHQSPSNEVRRRSQNMNE